MKLSLFNKSSAKAAPVAVQPLLTLEQVKAQLRVMPPKQLKAVYEAALERATPTRVPVTLRAMEQLNKEAVYVSNGQQIGAPIRPETRQNAFAFVNMRHMVANMPVPGVVLPKLPDGYDARTGMVYHPAAQPPLPARAPKLEKPHGGVPNAKKQVAFALPSPDGTPAKPLKGILKYPGV